MTYEVSNGIIPARTYLFSATKAVFDVARPFDTRLIGKEEKNIEN